MRKLVNMIDREEGGMSEALHVRGLEAKVVSTVKRCFDSNTKFKKDVSTMQRCFDFNTNLRQYSGFSIINLAFLSGNIFTSGLCTP